MLKYNTMIAKIVSILNTAKQNQKFPFHFFFRFPAEGGGGEGGGGALVGITAQSERTRQFQVTTERGEEAPRSP